MVTLGPPALVFNLSKSISSESFKELSDINVGEDKKTWEKVVNKNRIKNPNSLCFLLNVQTPLHD
jgi:hypothetical protein